MVSPSTNSEFWWEHAEVDIEHGARAFAMLEKYCKTTEQKET